MRRLAPPASGLLRFLFEGVRFVFELFVLFAEGIVFLAELVNLLLLPADGSNQINLVDTQQRVVIQDEKIVDSIFTFCKSTALSISTKSTH